MVRLEPRSDLLPELRLAVAAQPLPRFARPLDFGEVAVVRLEDVIVLRENRADVWVRPEASLLLDRRAPTGEGVHDFLLRLCLRVRREDARLRDRGRHLPARPEKAREQLGVNHGRLRIAKLRADVPCNAEAWVLVDPTLDEDREDLPFL